VRNVVLYSPTFDRAFARWCLTVECDRPSRWAADWLRSHEYMHVLQLEGYGLNFLPNYFWYWFRKDVAASPTNPYEAIGYLWQGWTYLTGEKPWATWWRPAP
jgi:hypothetical protein